MSEAGWLTVVGLVLTVVMAATGLVFSVVAWLLSRMIGANDREIRELKDSNVRLWARMTRYEVMMESHGWIPRRHKYPSPPPNVEEGA